MTVGLVQIQIQTSFGLNLYLPEGSRYAQSRFSFSPPPPLSLSSSSGMTNGLGTDGGGRLYQPVGFPRSQPARRRFKGEHDIKHATRQVFKTNHALCEVTVSKCTLLLGK